MNDSCSKFCIGLLFVLFFLLIAVIFLTGLHKNDKLSWILDITVAYPNGIPLDLMTIVMGYRRACQTYLCYRLYPASQVCKSQNSSFCSSGTGQS